MRRFVISLIPLLLLANANAQQPSVTNPAAERDVEWSVMVGSGCS